MAGADDVLDACGPGTVDGGTLEDDEDEDEDDGGTLELDGVDGDELVVVVATVVLVAVLVVGAGGIAVVVVVATVEVVVVATVVVGGGGNVELEVVVGASVVVVVVGAAVVVVVGGGGGGGGGLQAVGRSRLSEPIDDVPSAKRTSQSIVTVASRSGRPEIVPVTLDPAGIVAGMPTSGYAGVVLSDTTVAGLVSTLVSVMITFQTRTSTAQSVLACIGSGTAAAGVANAPTVPAAATAASNGLILRMRIISCLLYPSAVQARHPTRPTPIPRPRAAFGSTCLSNPRRPVTRRRSVGPPRRPAGAEC